MRTTLLLLLLTACGHTATHVAQLPTTAEDQTMAGAKLYKDDCAGCHGDRGEGHKRAAALIGTDAMPLDPPATAKKRTGQFKTGADVVEFIQKYMPNDEPGTLTDADAATVSAYLFQQNNIDLGGKVLTKASAATVLLH
jgi:cytochrome c